ncbi:hypothetical protein RCL1_007735 [Eukaryota sp. TZLM3-RCL]
MVPSPHFESGILKVQQKNEEYLCAEEVSALQCLKKDSSVALEEEVGVIGQKRTIGQRLEDKERRRQQAQQPSSYVDLNNIAPTSNEVERMFSRCRQAFGMFRHNLSAEHLLLQLFLLYHRGQWDENMVRSIFFMKRTVEDDLVDSSDEDD